MLTFLRLLHLADSALPIGSLSHSYGLECLTSERHVTRDNIFDYISNLLDESWLMDAVYCRTAHGSTNDMAQLQALNERLSAIRVARETRLASLALGRRFLNLVADLERSEVLITALALDEMHFAVAFGLVSGALRFNADDTVMAFLHQSVLNILSTAQRLISLGQTDAGRIAWNLKLPILETTKKSAALKPEDVFCFSHLPDLASMRHPVLPTRLFIS